MKLLAYGGCHALVIKRLIDELGPPGRHSVDLLINFQMIARGEPFPFERIGAYDALVYSPVENKGAHNTSHVDEACAALGVQAVRFPWLEWHGYAPGADKDLFWGNVGWFYPGLIEHARHFSSFEAFARSALREFPSDEQVAALVAYSTGKLVDQERRVGCEVPVSDFILAGFRERRMFSIPDHPTLHLYRFLMDGIERVLGTRLIATWPSDLPEPQPEASTPILPRVAESLRLSFADATWRCDTQPVHPMSVEAFLALHFHGARRREPDPPGAPASDLALVTACRPTWIVGAERRTPDDGPLAVPIFTQMLLGSRSPVDARGHFGAEIVAPLAGQPPGGDLHGYRLFREDDWVCRS